MMSKRSRRILFVWAVAFFVFLSGLVVMFAFGFRYDFKNNHLAKTGSIVLKPNLEARIFVNNKLAGRTSFLNGSFSKKRLLPGKYAVRVEKDGHASWQKEIEVEEGLVSDFSRIMLFNQGRFEEVFALAARPAGKLLSVNQKEQKAVYGSKNTVAFYDLNEEGGQPIYKSSSLSFDPAAAKFIWGARGEETLIYDQTHAVYFDLIKKTSQNISQPKQYFLEKAVLKNGRLYFLKPSLKPGAGKELVWLSLENLKTGLVSKNLTSFFIDKNEVLAVKTASRGLSKLIKVGLDGDDEQMLAEFDLSGGLVIKKTESRNGISFVLLDSNLYSLKNGELSLISDDARDFAVSPDQVAVGWHTGQEFWVEWIKDMDYQPLKKSGERELVARVSESENIRRFDWYKNSGYVFLQLDNDFVAVETDLRGKANRFTVLSLNRQEQAWYDLGRNKIFKISNLFEVASMNIP